MSETNPVEAAKAGLDHDVEREVDEVVAGVASADAAVMPQSLIVRDVEYLFAAELDGIYVDDDGNELDMSSKDARKALMVWKRRRLELEVMQAAAQEREAQGPEDLHVFHVERPEQMAAFEGGLRWVPIKVLTPGLQGNEGVVSGHGVVIQFKDDDGETFRMSYRVSHVMDGIASLEPGERVRGDGVVFYPKPHHRDWLVHVAAVEGLTVERFVRRAMAQMYASSDVRASGNEARIAGKAGANADLMADLEAGRRARS